MYRAENSSADELLKIDIYRSLNDKAKKASADGLHLPINKTTKEEVVQSLLQPIARRHIPMEFNDAFADGFVKILIPMAFEVAHAGGSSAYIFTSADGGSVLMLVLMDSQRASADGVQDVHLPMEFKACICRWRLKLHLPIALKIHLPIALMLLLPMAFEATHTDRVLMVLLPMAFQNTSADGFSEHICRFLFRIHLQMKFQGASADGVQSLLMPIAYSCCVYRWCLKMFMPMAF